MSADFWAGYLSGAAGIIIGNPLDLVKTRLQAGTPASAVVPASGPAAVATATAASPLPLPQTALTFKSHFENAGTLVRGVTAPILGYGALNAILFVSYNRTLSALADSPALPANLAKVWTAGAIGGLATFIVSAPTELVKCRVQVSTGNTSSWSIAKDIWRRDGVRGLYYGGAITSVRDAVGYGFYFWSYEWSKQAMTSPNDTDRETAMKVLLCGGLAGIVTWASIFPLDVVKTRVQTQLFERPRSHMPEGESLLESAGHRGAKRLGTWEVARHAYQAEGANVFFRGLGICSVRAFVVNAVQWAVYEWMMRILQPS